MKRVLVVDDYPSFQTLYKFALEKVGYKVDVCSDGGEALQKCRITNYDVILLDLLLVSVSGLEFLRQFAKSPNRASAKIIVISNTSNDDMAKESLLLGADAFLTKSGTRPKDIVESVGKILDKVNAK